MNSEHVRRRLQRADELIRNVRQGQPAYSNWAFEDLADALEHLRAAIELQLPPKDDGSATGNYEPARCHCDMCDGDRAAEAAIWETP